jgi:hypothetical protein
MSVLLADGLIPWRLLMLLLHVIITIFTPFQYDMPGVSYLVIACIGVWMYNLTTNPVCRARTRL